MEAVTGGEPGFIPLLVLGGLQDKGGNTEGGGSSCF